ncbi:hypothetical protein ACWC5F_32350 [Streptomyces sp. NPDC001272]
MEYPQPDQIVQEIGRRRRAGPGRAHRRHRSLHDPLPDTVTALLERLKDEIDKLTKTSPVAAVRAVRRTEATARRGGYWAARSRLHDLTPVQAAAAFGLTENAVRRELARLGRYGPYTD